MDNSEKVLDFKESLVKEFFRMRKTLLEIKINQQNQEWLNSRNEGKKTRKDTTGVYKEYLEYAIKNGSATYSKKPNLVYSKFTNMINKSLFDIECKLPKGKTREYMSKPQLNIIQSAELAAQKIIQDEIDKGTEYHDIYKITKAKMNQYADIIGKTTIIDLVTNNQVSLLNK